MHDTDTTHDLVHTDLASSLQLLAPLLTCSDHLSHAIDNTLADSTNGLQSCHFIPYRRSTSLEIRTNGFKLCGLRTEMGKEVR